MSLTILREFFNALGVKKAECGYDEFWRHIADLANNEPLIRFRTSTKLRDFPYASYEPAYRDPMKAMG